MVDDTEVEVATTHNPQLTARSTRDVGYQQQLQTTALLALAYAQVCIAIEGDRSGRSPELENLEVHLGEILGEAGLLE